MPIVQHTLETSTQADGSTNNTLRMWDQAATEYTISFAAPAGFNLEARVQLAIEDQNRQLAEAEFEAIVGS